METPITSQEVAVGLLKLEKPERQTELHKEEMAVTVFPHQSPAQRSLAPEVGAVQYHPAQVERLEQVEPVEAETEACVTLTAHLEQQTPEAVEAVADSVLATGTVGQEVPV